MKMNILCSFILGLGLSMLMVSCDDEKDNLVNPPLPVVPEELTKEDSIINQLVEKYPDTEFNKLMAEAKTVDKYRGKSIGYLGASLVNLPECNVGKRLIWQALGCTVTSYGHGGYGYAAKHNLQPYAKYIGDHDIYVIWGTTNDYFLNVPVGSPKDFTAEDGYDPAKLKTVCGGMNYAIAEIRKSHPKALILAYTTTKVFNLDVLDGSVRPDKHVNNVGKHFYDYVDAQLAVCKRAGIPCLNVWDWNGFRHKNWQEFYMRDGVHLQHSGYFMLGMQHLRFLMDMKGLVE